LQSHFSTKTGNTFLVSSIHATCPAHLKLFVLTTLIILVRSKSREAPNYLSISNFLLIPCVRPKYFP
jgi:hypothetical protein